MKSFLTLPLFSVALQLIGASTRTFAAPDETNPFVIDDEDFYVYKKPTAPASASAPATCSYKTVKEMCEDLFPSLSLSKPSESKSGSLTSSASVSSYPSGSLTSSPSESYYPSGSPSETPSESPSASPSETPSESPSASPSESPSIFEQDTDDFYEFCRSLRVVDYMKKTGNSLLNKKKKFTIFAPDNAGYGKLVEVLGSHRIGETALKKIFKYSIVAGSKLETADIICDEEIDVIANKPGSKPKIICKEDIDGNLHTYIKGKANKDGKPQFKAPNSVYTDVCNANIFSMNGAILVKKPTVNIKA